MSLGSVVAFPAAVWVRKALDKFPELINKMPGNMISVLGLCKCEVTYGTSENSKSFKGQKELRLKYSR